MGLWKKKLEVLSLGEAFAHLTAKRYNARRDPVQEWYDEPGECPIHYIKLWHNDAPGANKKWFCHKCHELAVETAKALERKEMKERATRY